MDQPHLGCRSVQRTQAIFVPRYHKKSNRSPTPCSSAPNSNSPDDWRNVLEEEDLHAATRNIRQKSILVKRDGPLRPIDNGVQKPRQTTAISRHALTESLIHPSALLNRRTRLSDLNGEKYLAV